MGSNVTSLNCTESSLCVTSVHFIQFSLISATWDTDFVVQLHDSRLSNSFWTPHITNSLMKILYTPTEHNNE